MASLSTEMLAALEPVVVAARSHLADLEAEEIPASLRRVAQSSARSLPPPLSRRLIEVLDGDAVLRAAVLGTSGELPPVAKAFLEREAGWWDQVAAALGHEVSHRAAQRLEKLERRIAELESFVAKAKQRTADAKAETAKAKEDAAVQMDAMRARLTGPSVADRVRDAAAAAHVVALESQLAQLETEVADLSSLADAQRDRLRRLRRKRSTPQEAGSGSLPTDPLAMARALDHQVGIASRAVAVPPSRAYGAPVRRQEFALPAGVSPDSSAALKWLQGAPAATVIVDGYNVLFRAGGAGAASGAARSRLEAALQRLHVQSAEHHAVIVVYDSTLSGAPETRTRSKGVEVRFAAADRLADEEIAELAMRTGGSVVVVSSDREVREAAEDAGAVALWSEALLPLVAGG